MTRRRWIADEFSGDRAALTGAHAEHLARVLRARVGQEFDIACGNELRRGTIVQVGDERVEFELGESIAAAETQNVALLLAVFKFDRFEWAVEKCTELGVGRITPVIARRTETHLASAAQKRVDRWRRIAHEAAQQSRRLSAPVIDDPTKLKQALAVPAEGERLLLNENERALRLRDLLGGDEAEANSLSLAVGPEGGWSEDEIKAFIDSNWKSVTLGPTVLRAETAAIACMAAINALLL